MYSNFLPVAWMYACCGCCVLSGRGLCDRLITLPEESYGKWRVNVISEPRQGEDLALLGLSRHAIYVAYMSVWLQFKFVDCIINRYGTQS